MDTLRAAVGIAISIDFRRLVAVYLRAEGCGLDLQAEVIASASRDVPEGSADQIASLIADHAVCPSRIAPLAAELAVLQAAAVREASANANRKSSNRLPIPLIAGSVVPSVWSFVDGVPQAEMVLSDAPRLAEFSGLNVVDGFSARDLATGGQGGPLEPLAEWLLLHDAKRNRVLLDLGPTIRMTFLPRGCEPSTASDIMATDVVPGCDLLDALTEEWSEGGRSGEIGWRLAVRGTCVQPLFERLLAAPSLGAPPPQWHPVGAPVDWFVEETRRFRQTNVAESSDLLCTATHCIAEAVARCLEACVPRTPTAVQLMFFGEGEENGLLLGEICRRLPPFERTHLPDPMENRDVFKAACAATLAMLYIDQTPQTLPRITGIRTPRVLGRLTPGSPKNWQRLVQEMAATAPATMSLRSAM